MPATPLSGKEWKYFSFLHGFLKDGQSHERIHWLEESNPLEKAIQISSPLRAGPPPTSPSATWKSCLSSRHNKTGDISTQSSSQHNYMKPEHIITSSLQDLWPTMMENKDRDILLVWIHHSQKAICFNHREVVYTVLFLMKTFANRAETDAGMLEEKRKMKKMAILLLFRKYAIDSLYYWKTPFKYIEASNVILAVSWVWETASNLSGTGEQVCIPY